MERESTFKVDAGDAALIAAGNRRAPPRPPGLASWLALLASAALAAGSLFIAAGLPVEPPHDPSTPLLRQFCARLDCAFLRADIVVHDVRLAAPSMRAGAAPGTIVFGAEAIAVADAKRRWPTLVFEFFDADRHSLGVRRIAGDEYAPPAGVPTDKPFAVEIAFAAAPPAAAYYSITQSTQSTQAGAGKASP